MKEQKQDIDALFSSKLSGFEVDVPHSVWAEVASKLSEKDRHAVVVASSRKRVLLSVLGAVASLLLLLFVFSFPFSETKKVGIKKEPVAKQGVSEPRFAVNKPIASINKVQNTNSVLVHSTSFKREMVASGNEEPKQNHFGSNCADKVLQEVLLAEKPSVDDTLSRKDFESEPKLRKNDDPELRRKTKQFSNFAEDMTNQLFSKENLPPDKENRKGNFALLLGGGAGLSSQTKTANQFLSLTSASMTSASLKNGNSTMSMISSSKSNYELEHSWPITFAIGVSKRLTDFVDLELGLSYSYLYSKQKGESNASMRQTQQFSYVGVPVGLNFKVAHWNRFRFGFLVGGSVQKDIDGRLKQQIRASSSYEDYSTTKIHQNRIQPSLNVNMHISYSIVRNLSVFGKVGGAYYFNMDDTYNTIYSDKNFLPDVGFGLSYRLGY